MLGEDTLFLTRNGFVPLRDLKRFDEVLTEYGTFEPIVDLGKWENVTVDYNLVESSTNERFICDDSLMWVVYDKYTKSHENVVYTDELCDKNNYAAKIMDIIQCKKSVLYNPYNYCAVVPMCIQEEYLLSNRETRLECFAGLVDSPICEVGTINGTYNFYTKYYPLEKGIISLARALGYLVSCEINEGVTKITVHISGDVEEIPFRDEYKMLISPSRYKNVMLYKSVNKLTKDVNKKARKVSINGGNAVIGYSLLPIICQVDKD